MTGRRVVALLAALVGLALALSSCADIPTSGPIGEGKAQVADPGGVDLLAQGPQPDADPEAIVNGFLTAGVAGFKDNFVTARDFLFGSARSTWKPLDRVVVYPTSSTPQIDVSDPTKVVVSFPVSERLDADGRFSEAAPDAQESVTFGLTQDSDKQWRISDLPDGLILSQPSFSLQYRQRNLYFLSPDNQFLVPEPRWFPNVSLPVSVMKALLAGPSAWLRDAVHTAIPDGTTLTPPSVPVGTDGVAQVGLGPPGVVLSADRSLMLAQIDASLTFAGVGSVEVTAGGVLLDGADDTLDSGPLTNADIQYLQSDVLTELRSDKPVKVDGVGSLAGLSPHAPARSESGKVQVLLSGSDNLVLTPEPGGKAATLVTGHDLVAPSVDRLGWAWTASAGTHGTVVAARAGSDSATIDVDWLAGRTIRSLRVSRDGARIAIVSSGSDGVTVDVAGISRDDAGAPQQLGDPLRVGLALVDASQVVWIDDTDLGVLGRGAANAPEVLNDVPVAGLTAPQSELDKLVSIAGGMGPRAVVGATSGGGLYRFDGVGWSQVPGVKGASDPSYPG